jgi:hypothetical protein
MESSGELTMDKLWGTVQVEEHHITLCQTSLALFLKLSIDKVGVPS